MKLGIITLYYGGNFGTYFQASCLQKQITQLGHQCEILNATIRGMEPWKYYLLVHFNRFVPVRLRKTIGKVLPFYSGYCTLENDTKLLPKSKIAFSLKSLSKEYDGIILGSDEIWSTDFSEVTSQLVFWGQNAQCPVVSYASFGVNSKISTLEKNEAYRILYNKMLSIGVRDEITYNNVRRFAADNIPLKIVLDPTLLNPYYVKKEGTPGNHVLVYGPDFSEGTKKSILEFARSRQLPVICMGWYHEWCDSFYEPEDADDVQSVFANSRYIINSSFHGTIFFYYA